MVGRTIPEVVVLGSIRKQVEQVRRSKPVKSFPPWMPSAPAFRILLCLFLMMGYDLEGQAK